MHEYLWIDLYRCKVDRASMASLIKRSDARAFAQVIPQFALFAVTGAAAYELHEQLDAGNWPWMLPALLFALFLHGTNGSFFGSCTCHEPCRKTRFASQSWNTFFLRIYAFPSWFDPVGYRASHIRHHQATTPADREGEVVRPPQLDRRNVPFFPAALALDLLAPLVLVRFLIAKAQGDLTQNGFEWLRRVVLAIAFIRAEQWFQHVVVKFRCLHAVRRRGITEAPYMADFRDQLTF